MVDKPLRERLRMCMSYVLAASLSLSAFAVPAQALATPETNEPMIVASDSNVVNFHVRGVADGAKGRELLDLVNDTRTKQGKSQLTWDPDLEKVALQRAIEISINYSHTRPDNRTFDTAFSDKNASVLENIAAGYTTASEVNAAYSSNPGQFANMGNDQMKSFGAALFVSEVNNSYFWVECFSSGAPTGNSDITPTTGTYTTEVAVAKQLIRIDIAGPENAQKLPVGSSSTLTFTVNNEAVVPQDVNWKSENTSVATISSTGVVTAKAQGTVKITASLKAMPEKSLTYEMKVVAGSGSSASTGAWNRLAGAERYQTMERIVQTGFSRATTAVSATGANFPDALAASALAGAKKCPVILTAKSQLSPQASTELKRLGVTSVEIMGGTSAVSEAVENQLKQMGITCKRIAGADRMATSVQALKAVREAGSTSDTVIIATGQSFADSLSIGPYAYATGTPIVLCEADGTLTDGAVQAIDDDGGFKKAIIVGGTSAVNDFVKEQLGTEYYQIERLGGKTRYETSAAIATFEAAHGLNFGHTTVATGKNFPDALAGAPFSGSNKGILLLVADQNSETINLIANNAAKVRHAYILGGEAAVSADLASYLGTLVH